MILYSEAPGLVKSVLAGVPAPTLGPAVQILPSPVGLLDQVSEPGVLFFLEGM